MKAKFLLVLLVLFAVFTVTGCSGDADDTATTTATTEKATEEESTEEESTEPAYDQADKDAFIVYVNESVAASFIPKNEEIVAKYVAAAELEDGTVLLETLQEIIVLNAVLYEELEAYAPTTTAVEELHAIYFDAVSKRELAYADIMLVLTDLEASQEEIDAAFDKLEESDAAFMSFVEKLNELKTLYGIE